MLEPMTLSGIATPLAGHLPGVDARFCSVSTDSRTLQPGQLFVALDGPRFDGHAYLAEVAGRGAVAALVSRPVDPAPLPLLQVADTRRALGQLAALNRLAFAGPVVAVTGSSGKTTVKEMLASILRQAPGPAQAVLATRGNLNNELGVPLTLLELSAEHRAAVIELGASAVGDIAYTVGLVRPRVSVITNAGTAHVGAFGGPENIVRAKGEILEGLDAQGIAVLNRDDPAFSLWRQRAAGKLVLSFALQAPGADFRAEAITLDAQGCPGFRLVGPSGSQFVQLALLGRHNVANALAAAAAASALDIDLAQIVAGLQAMQPVRGRTAVSRRLGGIRLIDDSYNANPVAMCAAIDILAGFSGGQTLLVLGDMGELGDWAEQGHRDVGAYARGRVDALWAVGPLMHHAVAAFGRGGRHFADQASLIRALQAECQAGMTLLVKGSRSAAMDRVVAALGEAAMEKH